MSASRDHAPPTSGVSLPAHTPGPWSIKPPWSGFSAIHGPAGELIFGLAAGGDAERQPVEVIEANARLIAAAPDLLEASEPDLVDAAADRLERLGSHESAVILRDLASRQRSAVAKALGASTASPESGSPEAPDEQP